MSKAVMMLFSCNEISHDKSTKILSKVLKKSIGIRIQKNVDRYLIMYQLFHLRYDTHFPGARHQFKFTDAVNNVIPSVA